MYQKDVGVIYCDPKMSHFFVNHFGQTPMHIFTVFINKFTRKSDAAKKLIEMIKKSKLYVVFRI